MRKGDVVSHSIKREGEKELILSYVAEVED